MSDDNLTCPRCGGMMEFVRPDESFGPDADAMMENYCCADCGLWLQYEPDDTTSENHELGLENWHWGLG